MATNLELLRCGTLKSHFFLSRTPPTSASVSQHPPYTAALKWPVALGVRRYRPPPLPDLRGGVRSQRWVGGGGDVCQQMAKCTISISYCLLNCSLVHGGLILMDVGVILEPCSMSFRYLTPRCQKNLTFHELDSSSPVSSSAAPRQDQPASAPPKQL